MLVLSFLGGMIVALLWAINARGKRKDKADAARQATLMRASEPQVVPDPLPDPPADAFAAVLAALATLQDLRAKNLITEEEYQAKRREHLDRL
jgi:hypothetical protein